MRPWPVSAELRSGRHVGDTDLGTPAIRPGVGEIAIFVIFLLEESGVPLPVPGDLALIWAGYHVAGGQSDFVVVLLVVELATLIGASTLYWLRVRGGRPLVVGYGRFLHIDKSRLLQVESWVGQRALLGQRAHRSAGRTRHLLPG